MRLLRYAKYFFYLLSNWNLRIALHIIRNEVKGEKKYGINTTGADELLSLERKGVDISHATIYMPASYDMIKAMLDELKKFNLKYFLDIGCGKGRAMCVAAHYQFQKVSGIDFSKGLCAEAVNNLEKTKASIPSVKYEVLNNNAFYYKIPGDVDCIFLFNPFDEMIMSGVIENIQVSLRKNPRKLFIIYLNPLNKELFLKAGFKEIFYLKKIRYLEGSILSREIT